MLRYLAGTAMIGYQLAVERESDPAWAQQEQAPAVDEHAEMPAAAQLAIFRGDLACYVIELKERSIRYRRDDEAIGDELSLVVTELEARFLTPVPEE
jgi:hypothetical protein